MANQTQTMFSPPPPGAVIKPYTGTFGRTQLIHLLRRTLFGVSPADMKAFEGKTLDEVVTALLNVSATQPAPPVKNYSTDVKGKEPDMDPVTKLQRKDAAGNLLYVTLKNPDDSVKKDGLGNILYSMVTVDAKDDYDIPSTAAKYPNWKGLKMGETWVNYRVEQGVTFNSDGRRNRSLKSWWIQLMVEQERNLREKMTLFWHNHIATEMVDVNNAQMSYFHVALLRKYAIGNFKELIKEVTLDPSMLYYLNGDTNDGSGTGVNVNENFGRELQELFCVGKGLNSKYTEDDVKAAARVLSGWVTNQRQKIDETKITTIIDVTKVSTQIDDPAIPYKSYYFPSRHDKKDKQFSAFYGNKVIKGDATLTGGVNEINQLMDMIFANVEVSKFLVRKLYTFFVHYTIDAAVETNVIEPLAELFRTSNYDIKPVLKALFTSDWFYKTEVQGAVIKSPIDFSVGHARMLGLTLPSDAKAFEAKYAFGESISISANNAGQNLGDPPNVAGWAAYYQAPLYYEVWIDSATFPIREGFQKRQGYNTIADTLSTVAPYINAESKGIKLPYDWVAFAKQMSDPSNPNMLIMDIAEYLHPIGISQSVKDKLKTRYLLDPNKFDNNWTTAYKTYIANPATTDASAKAVPAKLQALCMGMFFAAEYHLH